MVAFDNDIEQCLLVLKSGGLILYPTDTVWGIGCDATNSEAVEKVLSLKKRPDRKGMIVLLADEKQVRKYVSSPDLRVFDYLKNVQKPTTVIYRGGLGLADNLLPGDGSVGIRIVKDVFCKHLIRRFQKPVVSTSANVSGQPPPAFFGQIEKEIKNNVDYIVQYRQEDTSPTEPSAVIKYTDGDIVVIRS